MRDRLLSLALLGRKDCADQPAGRATRRLAKATSREAGGSADKAKRPRRKARKRKDGAGGTATPSPPPASTPAPTSTPVPAAPEAEE